MALKVPYRNAQIIFDNHTDLLNNQSEFDKICLSVNSFFENLQKRASQGLFAENKYMFLRIAPFDQLTIYVGISRKHNPYLFLYNAKTKEITTEIPYELFKNVGDSPYIFVLEDMIRSVNQDKYKTFANEKLVQKFEELAQEYDEKY